MLALLDAPWVVWAEGRLGEVAVALFGTFIGLVFVVGILDWLVLDALERRNRNRNAQIRATLSLHLAYMINRALPEDVSQIDSVLAGLRASSPDLPDLLASYWPTLEVPLTAALATTGWPIVSGLAQRTHALLPQLLWLTTVGQDAVHPDCVAAIVDAYGRLDSAERVRMSEAASPPATGIGLAADFVAAVGALVRAHRALQRS